MVAKAAGWLQRRRRRRSLVDVAVAQMLVGCGRGEADEPPAAAARAVRQAGRGGGSEETDR
eukprot:SAG11_NODE_527_length_8731_cov_3.883457_6_plen_61_part_00